MVAMVRLPMISRIADDIVVLMINVMKMNSLGAQCHGHSHLPDGIGNDDECNGNGDNDLCVARLTATMGGAIPLVMIVSTIMTINIAETRIKTELF